MLFKKKIDLHLERKPGNINRGKPLNRRFQRTLRSASPRPLPLFPHPPRRRPCPRPFRRPGSSSARRRSSRPRPGWGWACRWPCPRPRPLPRTRPIVRCRCRRPRFRTPWRWRRGNRRSPRSRWRWWRSRRQLAPVWKKIWVFKMNGDTLAFVEKTLFIASTSPIKINCYSLLFVKSILYNNTHNPLKK